jgi:hypothetical protein
LIVDVALLIDLLDLAGFPVAILALVEDRIVDRRNVSKRW